MIILNPFERKSINETFDILEAVQTVSEDINLYYKTNSVLPADLRENKFFESDAVHRKYYWEEHLDNTFTYEKVDRTNYRICASFPAIPPEAATAFPGYPYERFVVENTGETCFDINSTEDVRSSVYRGIHK